MVLVSWVSFMTFQKSQNFYYSSTFPTFNFTIIKSFWLNFFHQKISIIFSYLRKTMKNPSLKICSVWPLILRTCQKTIKLTKINIQNCKSTTLVASLLMQRSERSKSKAKPCQTTALKLRKYFYSLLLKLFFKAQYLSTYSTEFFDLCGKITKNSNQFHTVFCWRSKSFLILF